MKILLIAENWPPRQGGIERYLSNLATCLGQDNDVTVIAPHSVGEESSSVKVITKRFFWPIIKPAWLPLCIGVYRLAKKERFDVVLCGKALFEGQIARYLKRYFQIPFVVFTYGMEIKTWQSQRRNRRKLMTVLRAVDIAAYINNETKDDLSSLGVADSKLMKLTPAVGEEFLRSVPENKVVGVLEKTNVAKPYVLSVGRLVKRKGFDQLIEAFAQVEQTRYGDWSLVVVGDGPEKTDLANMAEKNLIGKRVIFTGAIDDMYLRLLYGQAGFFALTPKNLPNDIEGFGIVYLEAAACGLAVLATKTGGVTEAVVDGETGILVGRDNIKAITVGLERLMLDAQKRSCLGENGKRRVENDFRWSQRASQLVEEIQKRLG
ncbi:MAG: glycosyltransferase family 4 protein [Candidatus Andersenbacteria bacterium]|nr:glycosyltransferase family 4 protein [bacterium]MDZ4225813.1 glycosyltransferase family 4 protein [Candidatus Andersenbacteria bacterium]